MEMEKKNLITFLKKIRMDGKTQISECLLRFEDSGLNVSANSIAKEARVIALLKPSAFKKYEALGNIGINDLTNVIKVLERFNSDINLKKEGNLLTVSSGKSGSKKSVSIELVSEKFLETETGTPEMDFKDVFTLAPGRLGEIFKDVKVNTDATVTIVTAEKEVMFKNTGKYKFSNILSAPTCKGGVEVNFGDPLMDATAQLTETLEVSVSNDYPAKVMEKTEDSVVTVIVAPRVDE